MRQRTTTSTNSSSTTTSVGGRTNQNNTNSWYLASVPRQEDPSSSDESDIEENIQASQPDEGAFANLGGEQPMVWCHLIFDEFAQHTRQFIREWSSNKIWWAQGLTIAVAALLTYSYNNSNLGDSNDTNVQIAVMTLITLVGASPFCQTHLTAAAVGAFVGGHNIIGATGLESATPTSPPDMVSYLWLLLLAGAVTAVWCFVMNNPWHRILDGYSGRLGTTTFIGMNLSQLLVFGPAGVVDWNRYYFGFIHLLHVAEEADSTSKSLASAWKWTEEAELAIGYIVAVVWLAVVAGATRILHHQHVQRWHNNNNNQQQQNNGSLTPPKPLNNVLVPVLWALFCMLLVNMTQYKHAPGLYNGFAVGAYVGMASLQKIPSVTVFAMVGLVAAAWGLTLTPFVVGFAGKAGFTAMLGHVTYSSFVAPMISKLWQQRQAQLSSLPEQQQQNQHFPAPLHTPSPPLQQQHNAKSQEPEQPTTVPNKKRPESHHQQEPQSPPSLRKQVKPKKTQVYYTKQQRRQQQRLQHLQQQQQHQPEQQQLQQTQQQQHRPLLHHRAWSALPAQGDGTWQHPQIDQ
ncbi:expressed unknown protein [Seminavis robusta]|uniref:Uncharacterized protein n=1 Tax=Seminavis robusta TaxID=568900 RepID=A0A9N8HMM7_9STRA|nr:expressed unknown protein [Seminavis robusta]|eukprot:Sro1012_g231230.1 n/a (571) ;mRNA; f:29033-30745